ncbi:MAG: chorismate-binding protein [Thiohalomonadales bacterium]
MKILIIDNYDSFTQNIADLVFRETQCKPIIVYNDQITYADIIAMPIDGIIISAGPGRPEHPKDLGVAHEVIVNVPKPVLGICLGMQAIVYFYGGKICYAPEQMHGRTSSIRHNAKNLFADIPQAFTAMRYHSLIVDENLPEHITCTAWTDDNIVMAVQHRSKPLYGVQFHPESICTCHGNILIGNFCRLIDSHYKTTRRDLLTAPTTPKFSSHHIHVESYHRWIDPSEVFEALFANATHCFWLDSNSPQHESSSVSYMGDNTGPHSHVVTYNNVKNQLVIDTVAQTNLHIFDYLDNFLKLHYCDTNELCYDFVGGFVGWFAYELRNGPHETNPKTAATDDAAFIFADRFLIFDHKKKSLQLVAVDLANESQAAVGFKQWVDSTTKKLDAIAPLDYPQESRLGSTKIDSAAGPIAFEMHTTKQAYLEIIKFAKEKIRQGESYEICLTNSLSTMMHSSGYEVYRNLRRLSPAPFSSYIKIANTEVVSSSPERFLTIDRENKVSSKPIKGTIGRNADAQIDRDNLRHLRNNIKDRAENLMIVDLLRNDLAKVCEYGSITVPKLLEIESFASVHQLVSTIEGSLTRDKTAIDCIRACFPGGSMTGAPKARSMDILSQLETQARGIYSGGLGYLALNGCCDLSIVIRTIIVERAKLRKSQTPLKQTQRPLPPKFKATIGCGGAIVALSGAEQEYAEILLKAKSLLEAIVITETGIETDRQEKVSSKYSYYTIKE